MSRQNKGPRPKPLVLAALCATGLAMSPVSPVSAEEPGLYSGGMFYRTSYMQNVAKSPSELSAFNKQFFDEAHRPGSRSVFVLDDFDSYVGGDEVDSATFTPLATAKAKKLSDGNPMSGAYLNGDATDSQNLIYTDTLMGDPATVDSSGRHVTFKLRSQMTRKLNSYDWDVANRTESFSDAPLVISAEYDTTDKNMLTIQLTLKRPLARTNSQYGIKYKGTNTGSFFLFPVADDSTGKPESVATSPPVSDVKPSSADKSEFGFFASIVGLAISAMGISFL